MVQVKNGKKKNVVKALSLKSILIKNNVRRKREANKKRRKAAKNPQIAITEKQLLPLPLPSILVPEATIEHFVQALVNSEEKEKTALLDDVFKYFLQVTLIKIPIGPTRNHHISIKHSVLNEDSEVCLIVKDLKRGRKIDYEPTKQFYQELLDKHNVKGITRVLPMTELVTEFAAYEAKIKLLNSYDLFLVDGCISHHVGNHLGSIGIKLKKNPISVRQITDAPSLKTNIEHSMRSVVYRFPTTGNNFAINIGTNKMSVGDITQNIYDCIKTLQVKLPGSWSNISKLHLMTNTPKKSTVPLFVNLINPNKVPTPTLQSVVKTKIQKAKKLLELKNKKDQLIVTDKANVRLPACMPDIEVRRYKREFTGVRRTSTGKEFKRKYPKKLTVADKVKKFTQKFKNVNKENVKTPKATKNKILKKKNIKKSNKPRVVTKNQ